MSQLHTTQDVTIHYNSQGFLQNRASYEDNGCENHMVKDMNFPTGRETESYSIRYMWPNVDGRRWEV